ncbi:hypothetical protein PYCCODRAFT_1305999 [Trametes coccinea BRFM310]|uniref:Uncharacterized protein n=1 Tax=Trametes coccinea (strain BRFM310) TaxID=1353009 RepID=A0A1Y2I5R6_TRAC3|nr:hypothetical protein PYCCODRAFT_1305999 [Trametes coccinea BRFM310]
MQAFGIPPRATHLAPAASTRPVADRSRHQRIRHWPLHAPTRRPDPRSYSALVARARRPVRGQAEDDTWAATRTRSTRVTAHTRGAADERGGGESRNKHDVRECLNGLQGTVLCEVHGPSRLILLWLRRIGVPSSRARATAHRSAARVSSTSQHARRPVPGASGIACLRWLIAYRVSAPSDVRQRAHLMGVWATLR